MNAVWLVRHRELTSRLRFWASIVGYDPRDRSLIQGIYLIYVVIFFSLWGFAVLSLLANWGAGVLSLVEGASPSMTATMIVAVVLLFDAILRGYSSGKRSPFIFSESDAELICQTPVDRRQVALAWCLGDWLTGGLAFGALTVILRFSSLQLVEQGGIVWAHLPGYLLAGTQAASIILPLYMAFMAIDYALGALRLQRDKENPWLRWIPVGVAVVLITLALINRRGIQIILSPILFPLKAGFGEAYWPAGFILALTLAMGGMLVLYWASPWLNLSRAAQESRFRWAVGQVSWLGDSHLSQQLKVRQRLGAGHSVSQIRGRAGYSALVWKDWVTTLRAMNFSKMLGWLSIFGVYLGMILVPDWGVRLWAFIILSLMVGQRCTERLRTDLEVWAISRQLPFSGRETLVAEIAMPALGATLLCWFAIGASFWLGFSPQLWLVALTPAEIICIALAAAFDILRNCRSSQLLSGQVAELGAGGLIIGALLAGIPLFLVSWLTSRFNSPGFILLISILGLALSLGIIYVLWKLAADRYNEIQ